jgi:hypothetical protein
MAENVEYRSLCSTCTNNPDCSLAREPSEPVLHCEQFEVYRPPAPKIDGKNLPLFAELRAAQQRDSDGFIGLCSDCEGRRNCLFPRPEGGVWHCEEYE